jgi:hypothetical protein
MAVARQRGDLAYLIIGLLLGSLISTIIASAIKGVDADAGFVIVLTGSVMGMLITYGGAHWLRQVEAREKALRERKLEMSLPPAPPTQIVGQDCVLCSTKIIFELDGSFCRVCHRAYCEKCKDRNSLCDGCA